MGFLFIPGKRWQMFVALPDEKYRSVASSIGQRTIFVFRTCLTILEEDGIPGAG